VAKSAFPSSQRTKVSNMGRAAILWLLGVPIPIILLMWGCGYLS
jgi:hypothetical protein